MIDMRIIHTADWHLGQTFYGYERTAEHRVFLSWLENVVKERKADLLLLAGDVFDSPNPSAESQRMLYDFLKRITTANPEMQVVITAGNHDSAARLEAPEPLLKAFNVHVSGVVHYKDGEIDYERMIIPLKDGACCLAVPYLRHNDHPAAESYNEGVAKLYNELYERVKERYSPVIAMGHLQASGATVSVGDSSEHAIIGGMEGVDAGFANEGIAYTALGHLHKAQRVAKRDNVRYSGAPLPMSFAERNNVQSITEAVLDGKEIKIEKIIFDAPVKLISLPGTPKPIEEVLPLLEALPKGENDMFSPFLEVKVLVNSYDPAMRATIENVLKDKNVRLTRLEAVGNKKEGDERIITYEDFKKKSPKDLIKELYARISGEDMSSEIEDLLNEAIKEAEE